MKFRNEFINDNNLKLSFQFVQALYLAYTK